MTSYIQKVLQAEQKRRSDSTPSKTFSDAVHDLASSSGIFKGLRDSTVDKNVMERSKILPEIDDRSAITAYKMLRTRVLQRMRSNNWRNLIVTGAGTGEGKTLTACNLAVSISNDVNQSVLLVDLDLQRSSIASYFGLDAEAGIGDYLTGHAKIDDIVHTPEGLDRIAIVPNCAPVSNSSELIASPKMRQLLKWVHDRDPSTVTIFDMPPVLSCDDVLAFAPYADAILMVVSEGLTERDSLSRTMEMIGDRNLLGVVLNQSREQRSPDYYY